MSRHSPTGFVLAGVNPMPHATPADDKKTDVAALGLEDNPAKSGRIVLETGGAESDVLSFTTRLTRG
jgi:hypothetical protein